MNDKTLIILKDKRGNSHRFEFDTYEEACAWIAEQTNKYGIKLNLEHARFDKEPTIEIYKEKK